MMSLRLIELRRVLKPTGALLIRDLERAGFTDRGLLRAGNYAGFDLRTGGTMGMPIAFIADPGVVINAPNNTTTDGINVEDEVDSSWDARKVALRAPQQAVEARGRRRQHHQHSPVALADSGDRRRHACRSLCFRLGWTGVFRA